MSSSGCCVWARHGPLFELFGRGRTLIARLEYPLNCRAPRRPRATNVLPYPHPILDRNSSRESQGDGDADQAERQKGGTTMIWTSAAHPFMGPVRVSMPRSKYSRNETGSVAASRRASRRMISGTTANAAKTRVTTSSAETELDVSTLIARIPVRFQRRGGQKRIVARRQRSRADLKAAAGRNAGQGAAPAGGRSGGSMPVRTAQLRLKTAVMGYAVEERSPTITRFMPGKPISAKRPLAKALPSGSSSVAPMSVTDASSRAEREVPDTSQNLGRL